jgi:hypothetical protein
METYTKRTTQLSSAAARAAAVFALFACGIIAAHAQTIANGTYIITNVNSHLAIDNPGFSAVDGKDMQQYAVNNGTNQQWVVTNLGGNVITLTNASSGQFLEVAGASKAASALVDQNPDSGATNQNWNTVSLGSGHYELTNQNSGLALAVVGAGTTNGTGIEQSTYAGATSQQWIFTPLSAASGTSVGFGCIGACVACGENCTAAQGTAGTTTFQLTALASGNWNSAGVHTVGNYQIGHSNQLPHQQAAYFEFDLTPVQGRTVTDALILIPGSTDYNIETTYKPTECPAAPAPCFKAGIAAQIATTPTVYTTAEIVSPSSNNNVNIYLSGGDANRDPELGYGWVPNGLHPGVEFGAFTTVVFNENYFPARVQDEVNAGGDWVFWARDDFDSGESNLSNGICAACPGGFENYIWGSTGYNTGIIALITVEGGETSAAVVPNGIYELKNLNSGAALEVAGAKKADGVSLDQSAYTGESNQLWNVSRLADGNYTIASAKTGQQLDAQNAGAAVRIARIGEKISPEWAITPTTDGNYNIKSVRSGLLLGVAGGSTLNGADIVAGVAENGYAHQQWSFKPGNANQQASLAVQEVDRAERR